MIVKRTFLAIFIFLSSFLAANEDDYISCQTFRQCADFIVDKPHKFDNSKVQAGDIIYVEGGVLQAFFFQCHPRIAFPYILITHWSDVGMPGSGASKLDDSKLIAWFAINVEKVHPKLTPIPIGVNYNKRSGLEIAVKKANETAKSHLLYMNFNLSTYPHERKPVFKLFHGKSFCYESNVKSFEDYAKDLAASKFVLSPRGAGLDCFRTWEAIYMGSFPVVRSSSLDPLLEDLPVLIIDDWKQVTEEFLNLKYEELKNKTYNMEKLTPEYWIHMIQQKKIEYLLNTKS